MTEKQLTGYTFIYWGSREKQGAGMENTNEEKHISQDQEIDERGSQNTNSGIVEKEHDT